MAGKTCDQVLEELQQQAQVALREARPRADIEPLLQRLAECAPEGSDASVFACRHLAELCIETQPWRAALFARRVINVGRASGIVYGLHALALSLLGQFRASVSSYRHALALEPRNPWYHHNLGHILDVALDRSAEALKHLQKAWELQPDEDEIAASLARCLAKLGKTERARDIAERALVLDPTNPAHTELCGWLGALDRDTRSRRRTSSARSKQVPKRS